MASYINGFKTLAANVTYELPGNTMTGEEDPTYETQANFLGQFYLNTRTGKLFYCASVDYEPTTYGVWEWLPVERHSGMLLQNEGENITINDADNAPFSAFNIYGKTTQDGTPTPDAPVPLVSVAENGNITATVSDATGVQQTVSVDTANGLDGVPVASGGNYTDADGQQWFCNEIDFARGVYVQRCKKIVFDGTNYHVWTSTHSNGQPYIAIENITDVATSSKVLSSHYENVGWSNENGKIYVSSKLVVITDDRFTDVATAKTYLADNPVTIIYQLATPEEIALTVAECRTFRALSTCKNSTSITNDGGAHMLVEYSGDIKAYIDSKLNN